MATPANSLTLQRIVDNIAEDGWLCSDSRDRFIEAATDLIGEGWPTERVASFLGGLYNAALEECG